MLKAFWKFLSDVLWTIGAERLAMRCLLLSLETVNVTAPTIDLRNVPPGTVPTGPWDMEVIYENKEALEQLGSLRTNDIRIPKHVHDIN